MFTIEITNTERDTLLDLLKSNIMDLTYIKNIIPYIITNQSVPFGPGQYVEEYGTYTQVINENLTGGSIAVTPLQNNLNIIINILIKSIILILIWKIFWIL